MKTMLATLCLNEMEWLPRLYEQHKDWLDLTSWVFVEAADKVYAECSPERVTKKGLSVDGTSEFLRELASKDPRVTYIPHGFTSNKNPDQGKCAARQRYLDIAETVRPDFVFVLDADEFYTILDQRRIQIAMEGGIEFSSFCFPHVHPWRPPSIADNPLFELGVDGGLWKIRFVRGWRWQPGCCYQKNHNYVEVRNGASLHKNMEIFNRSKHIATCVHMGFTASLQDRQPKHKYYAARGEGKRDGRGSHVACRSAFETWKPGDTLPQNATVFPYNGPTPECFK